MASAVEIVRNFRHLHALVIGDAMLDSYLEGSAARLCTEGPVPVVRKTAEEQVPGGAANTATNLRALGAQVSYLGVVGDDQAGTILRAALAARGVEDRWLVEDESASTLHKMRILANDQYVVRFDAGDTHHCSPRVQQQLIANLQEVFPRCDLVVISDYCYGVVSEPLLDALRALRARRPAMMVVDSKDLRRFHRTGATIVTPNHWEARLAVDQTAPYDGAVRLDEIEGTGRRLLSAINAQYAAITMAAEGVLVLDREGAATHVPAHPVPQANDVGAGDSLTAALALSLTAGASAVEAARIGVEAASIAVARRRTAIVQHHELLQRMSLEDTGPPPTMEALATQLAQERQHGKTIVFTNGVFDILHAGHIGFLRQARQLGDILVVAINSDRSARRLKGKNRPINRERDRLALVGALDSVDHVVLFDEETPTELILMLRPDVHVKGGDYQDEALPESEAVREVGGRVVILPLLGSVSTSSVIDRIVSLALDEIGVKA